MHQAPAIYNSRHSDRQSVVPLIQVLFECFDRKCTTRSYSEHQHKIFLFSVYHHGCMCLSATTACNPIRNFVIAIIDTQRPNQHAIVRTFVITTFCAAVPRPTPDTPHRTNTPSSEPLSMPSSKPSHPKQLQAKLDRHF
jgi:hypothetical protein